MPNTQSLEHSVYELEEDRSHEQFFFIPETVESLANLAEGKVACLCTPTVAEKLVEKGKEEITLFDIDTRISSLWRSNNTLVPYDLKRGLHSSHKLNTQELTSTHEYSYDTIIFDPPFSLVTPEEIARNVNALLKFDLIGDTYAYIIYPASGGEALEEAFESLGFVGQEREDIVIKYQIPPKVVNDTRKKITCFQFRRV